MIFYADEFFWALLLLPLAAGFFLGAERRRRALLERFGNLALLDRLADSSPVRRRGKFTLVMAALLFLIFAMARPQFGTKSVMITGRGVDVVIALDTSKSMAAEDIKPSRFERSKREVQKLLKRLEGNPVGLIAFAGRAFPECPITTDQGALHMILDSLSVGMIPVPGTAIDEAIEKAIFSLEKGRAKSKALIIFSDGEEHEGDALRAAAKAAEKGIRVFTVGVGGDRGAPIPLKGENGEKGGYKRDRGGKTVLTRMNSEALREIAIQGGGGYFSGERGIGSIADEIESMEKSDIGSRKTTLYEERYQFFALVALVLLWGESLWRERRNRGH